MRVGTNDPISIGVTSKLVELVESCWGVKCFIATRSVEALNFLGVPGGIVRVLYDSRVARISELQNAIRIIVGPLGYVLNPIDVEKPAGFQLTPAYIVAVSFVPLQISHFIKLPRQNDIIRVTAARVVGISHRFHERI